MKVWIVGIYKGPAPIGFAWEFQGVFSTEAAAVAVCRDQTYMIGPAEIDAELPHETADWPGAYYPITQ
jgi:hypothetical protein